MKRHGKVIALVNDHQVLVEANDASVFNPGVHFGVYAVVPVPVDQVEAVSLRELEIPKGRLVCAAKQGESNIWLFDVERLMRKKTITRPNPIRQAMQGLTLADTTEVIDEATNASAQISEEGRFNITVGPVEVGDYVDAS